MGCTDNDNTSSYIIGESANDSIPAKPVWFVKTNNNFGDQMLQKLCNDEDNKNQNVTFSPYSMNMLLSMITNGASDEPQEEMLKATGMSKYGIDSLNMYNHELSTVIKTYAGAATLEVANAAWIEDGMAVKDSFTNVIKNNYSSDVKNINFHQTEAAQNTINNWCNEKTNGMIKEDITSGYGL